LALFLHKSTTLYGIFQAFSWWLEALCILPQLYMIVRLKEVENITAHIVLFLGLYRFFYILHWVYNWDGIVISSFLAGVVQTFLYADFIYYFIKSNQNDRIINLPI
jgi:ER lumen protein retaining receptor